MKVNDDYFSRSFFLHDDAWFPRFMYKYIIFTFQGIKYFLILFFRSKKFFHDFWEIISRWWEFFWINSSFIILIFYRHLKKNFLLNLIKIVFIPFKSFFIEFLFDKSLTIFNLLKSTFYEQKTFASKKNFSNWWISKVLMRFLPNFTNYLISLSHIVLLAWDFNKTLFQLYTCIDINNFSWQW